MIQRKDSCISLDLFNKRTNVLSLNKGQDLIATDSINRPGDRMAARRLIGRGVSPSPRKLLIRPLTSNYSS
jgi:hypothetical protein